MTQKPTLHPFSDQHPLPYGPNTDTATYATLVRLRSSDRNLRDIEPSGSNESILDNIAQDAHVEGDVSAMRTEVLSSPWQILTKPPHGREITKEDLVLEAICNTWVDMVEFESGGTFKDFMWELGGVSSLWGMTLHELGWQPHDIKVDGVNYSVILPTLIGVRPARRVVAVQTPFGRKLHIQTQREPYYGEPLEPLWRFLPTMRLPSDEHPKGVAILSSMYWPWIFKRDAWLLAAQFVQNFAQPMLSYKLPMDIWTNEAERKKHTDALIEAMKERVMVHADSTELSIESSSSAMTFQHSPSAVIIDYANSEFSKAVTAQTLATEIQGDGSRSATQVHRRRERGVAQNYKRQCESSLNRIFKMITLHNFPKNIPPKFEYATEIDELSLDDKILKIQTLQSYGIPLSENYVRKLLQAPTPRPGETLLRAPIDLLLPAPSAPVKRKDRPAIRDLIDADKDPMDAPNQYKPAEE